MEESLNDKYSTKNILFYRAIPPYVIPVPTEGYKIHSCTDCGDRFIFESSYNQHRYRKSLRITYTCRYCPQGQDKKVFYNRCNLLGHIRTHTFKTATINVSDFNIEPLPLKLIHSIINKSSTRLPYNSGVIAENQKEKPDVIFCVECYEDISNSGTPYKDRATHYMKVKYKDEVHSCPFCLFTLPTPCALRAHLRVHLKIPPYYCPECGSHLVDKCTSYPFIHDCEGFNMMRATTRNSCPVQNCPLFHPQDIENHLLQEHSIKVFKCPLCYVACFDESAMNKHFSTHSLLQVSKDTKVLVFSQCQICPKKLVLQKHIKVHMSSHADSNVYPCWSCGYKSKTPEILIEHFINHHVENESDKQKYRFDDGSESQLANKQFRVVKKCHQCSRNFFYKCRYENISSLPNSCPYHCSAKSKSVAKTQKKSNVTVICPLCKQKINQDWDTIKEHYSLNHKEHNCLDISVPLEKIDVNKYMNSIKETLNVDNNKRGLRSLMKKVKNREKSHDNSKYETVSMIIDTDYANASFLCNICTKVYDNKIKLESHFLIHRDAFMAYQCLECGQCFAVKTSFATHLNMEHSIKDVDNYINTKQCYNSNSLSSLETVSNEVNTVTDVSIDKSQCKICKERFNEFDELQKHFRTHGMAFLNENAQTTQGIVS